MFKINNYNSFSEVTTKYAHVNNLVDTEISLDRPILLVHMPLYKPPNMFVFFQN